MPETMKLACYRRLLWEEPNLLVVTGDAQKIFAGWEAYLQHHRVPVPDADTRALLLRLFAAAGLAAVSLPERESWGWSLSVPGRPVGLFCAVEPEGMLCGCAVAADAQAATAVVQRQKAGDPLTQSHYPLTTEDPVAAVEGYFAEAAQSLARIVLDDRGRGTLLHPLPGGTFAPVDGLSDCDVVARTHAAGDGFRLLEEVVLFYECRCTEDMILRMITGLPQQDRHDLWRNRSCVEVTCPRCGRTYRMRRQ